MHSYSFLEPPALPVVFFIQKNRLSENGEPVVFYFAALR